MNSLAIPTKQESLNLLSKYCTPDHIVRHSKRVWEVARLLGSALIQRSHPLDLDLLRASCLLHDIGKYPCILEGTKAHDVRGEQILLEEGFPQVAGIIVQHVILRSPKDAPVGEEHVLYYSDKRVVHDQIVSVEDRFVYLLETYARTPEAERGILWMKEETLRIERAIFSFLHFSPADLVDRLAESGRESQPGVPQ